MKRLLYLLLLVAAVAQPARAQDKVGTTAAQFLGIGVGARAMGMGGAQVATAEGPTALYWNPAAITTMPYSGVEFTHTNWLLDSNIEHVGAVLALGDAGHVGLSVTSLNYGEIEVTTIDYPEGTGERFTPMSLAVGVSYARSLTDRFAVGGTVKLVREQIKSMAASGAAVDLGVTYQTAFHNLRIGMALHNFGTSMQMSGTDLRLPVDVDEEYEGNVDDLPGYLETDAWPMPLQFRVGLAGDVLNTAQQRLTLSVDALAPYDNAQSANIGAEYAFRDLLFVRGGYRQAFKEVDADSGWSAGFGLRYALNDRVSGYLDYVVQWFEAGAFDPPQMFSAGITF